MPEFVFTTNCRYPILAPLFSPTDLDLGIYVNAVATRESRECAVGSAAIYLWLCASPQDENFQGKSVRPLFSTNWSLTIVSDSWRKKKKEIQRKLQKNIHFLKYFLFQRHLLVFTAMKMLGNIPMILAGK